MTIDYPSARRASDAFAAAMRDQGMTLGTVHRYGCCRCQAYHLQGDHLYEAHLMDQSKHGWEEVPLADVLLWPLL